MKIAKIESLHADAGQRNFDFLKITTDDGLVGWSEYNESFGGVGVSAVIAGSRRRSSARTRAHTRRWCPHVRDAPRQDRRRCRPAGDRGHREPRCSTSRRSRSVSRLRAARRAVASASDSTGRTARRYRLAWARTCSCRPSDARRHRGRRQGSASRGYTAQTTAIIFAASGLTSTRRASGATSTGLDSPS